MILSDRGPIVSRTESWPFAAESARPTMGRIPGSAKYDVGTPSFAVLAKGGIRDQPKGEPPAQAEGWATRHPVSVVDYTRAFQRKGEPLAAKRLSSHYSLRCSAIF